MMYDRHLPHGEASAMCIIPLTASICRFNVSPPTLKTNNLNPYP